MKVSKTRIATLTTMMAVLLAGGLVGCKEKVPEGMVRQCGIDISTREDSCIYVPRAQAQQQVQQYQQPPQQQYQQPPVAATPIVIQQAPAAPVVVQDSSAGVGTAVLAGAAGAGVGYMLGQQSQQAPQPQRQAAPVYTTPPPASRYSSNTTYRQPVAPIMQPAPVQTRAAVVTPPPAPAFVPKSALVTNGKAPTSGTMAGQFTQPAKVAPSFAPKSVPKPVFAPKPAFAPKPTVSKSTTSSSFRPKSVK